MTSNPRPAKGGGWAVLALGLVVLLLPMAYVASIGPALYLLAREEWLFIYHPLMQLSETWEPTDMALWYLSL
jgi:hypothetical protein